MTRKLSSLWQFVFCVIALSVVTVLLISAGSAAASQSRGVSDDRGPNPLSARRLLFVSQPEASTPVTRSLLDAPCFSYG